VKPGFSLISILISMTLSTMLMTAVFMIYNSINRTSRFIKNIADQDNKEMVLIQRLKKDFRGLSALWYTKNDGTDSEEQDANASSDKIDNNFFYSCNQNNSLDFLTFITTSVLPAYASNGPKFVRVVYLLQADLERPGLFKLMRKELMDVSGEIIEKDLKSGSFSELANGIKTIKMNYFYIEKADDEVVQAQAGNIAEPIKTLTDWDFKNKETESITKNAAPYSAQAEITFENEKAQTTTINFRIDILVNAFIKISAVQPTQIQSKKTESVEDSEPQETE
jgi:hypothetical protein